MEDREEREGEAGEVAFALSVDPPAGRPELHEPHERDQLRGRLAREN